jgi:hypothetical protein
MPLSRNLIWSGIFAPHPIFFFEMENPVSITRLTYISKYRVHYGDKKPFEELHDILNSARRNNSTKNVTGALIFDDEWFVQALEGESDDVMSILRKVEADHRHIDVKIIETATVPSRCFGNWWMGGLVRSGKTASLFVPYLVDGRFDPSHMTADQILSLMVALTAAGADRELAPNANDQVKVA